MRVIQKIATAFVAFGFPLSFASGCAPAGGGTALTPPASTLSSARSGLTSSTNRRAEQTAEWMQFGYDPGHSGYNPLETTITPQNVSNLQVAWNDSSIIQPGGIVVNDGTAYVDDMGQSNAGLYALDAATGTQQWYANLNLNGSWGSFTHAVAVAAGNLVVSPCSNGSPSFFLTGMCGLNAKTGKVLWSDYCSPYNGSPCGGLVNGGTSPTLYNKQIYFQMVQGVNEQPDTMAINPQTGAVVWDDAGVYHCPDGGDASNNPLPASNGLVFAVLACQGPSGSTEICGLSAASGGAVWCDETADIYIEALAAGGGLLLAVEGVGSNNEVLALNARTGAQVWSANLPGWNFSTLAIAKGRVFVEDGRAGVYALSAKTGKTLWSYTANGNIFQGGVLSAADGILYADGAGGNNGNVALTAFNGVNGNVIWTSGSIGNGGAPAAPVILNGTIYAGCYTVCAFTLPSNQDRKR